METRPGMSGPTSFEQPRIGGQTSGRGDFASGVNVGDQERLFSALLGGALVVFGLARRGTAGLTLAGLGATLAYRGLSGVCHVYRALGVNRAMGARGTIQGNLGFKIDRDIRVDAPPERVYGVWRNFANLPRFMSHLERVEELSRTRSRWTVRTGAGVPVSWEAEVINEAVNRLIAWRTVSGSVVSHAGSVQFEPTPDGRGTIVRVSMQYDPPAGELGHALVTALGQDPERQIADDLERFKRAIERGELAA